MRSVYNEEMDIFWTKYKKKIENMGYLNFLEKSDVALQEYLKLDFKELMLYSKTKNAIFGKSREEIRYGILKLRRLVALWSGKNVICGDFNISYSENDKYHNFPLFDKQNYEIKPTINTIHKIKVKLIDKYINEYNDFVDYKRGKGVNLNYITNLRDLRLFFMSECGCTADMSTYLCNLYKTGSAKKEVWDFSEKLESL